MENTYKKGLHLIKTTIDIESVSYHLAHFKNSAKTMQNKNHNGGIPNIPQNQDFTTVACSISNIEQLEQSPWFGGILKI